MMKPRNFKIIIIFVLLILAACSNQTSPIEFHIFIPNNCVLVPGQSVSVSLSGTNIPSDAKIEWIVDKGDISPNNESVAIFTAPQEMGIVVIRAIMTVNNFSTTAEEICEIKNSTTDVPPTIEVTTNPPTPTEIENDLSKVVISEIMANTCNTDVLYVNEYIELFNYGDHSVDVNGLFLMTTRQNGEPDKITSWQSRYPSHNWGDNLILNSTIIPPHKYAIVISPVYTLVESDFFMPYNFPEGTIILTVSEGDRIGNKDGNILGGTVSLDSILLFEGTTNRIQKVISTYGLDPDKIQISDLKKAQLDDLPIRTNICNSVQRKIASGPDMFANWEEVPNGNPGSGPYD